MAWVEALVEKAARGGTRLLTADELRSWLTLLQELARRAGCLPAAPAGRAVEAAAVEAPQPA
jgi:hypothetical protein